MSQMPESGDLIDAFSPQPGRCFRMVQSRQLQATHCYEPPAWKGVWRRPQRRQLVRRGVPDARAEGSQSALNGPAGRGMRAMLTLAAFAGLRVQEIDGLDRDDILEAKGLIRVRHGRGAKERIVPLHPDVPLGGHHGLSPRPRHRRDGTPAAALVRDQCVRRRP